MKFLVGPWPLFLVGCKYTVLNSNLIQEGDQRIVLPIIGTNDRPVVSNPSYSKTSPEK